MSFFDDADEAARERAKEAEHGGGWSQFRQNEPVWQRIPTEFLTRDLPLSVVLARNEWVALTLSDVEVYPTGFTFTMTAIRHPEATDDDPDRNADFDTFMGHPRSEDRLRVGLEYADGARATNDWPGPSSKPGEPPAAVLRGMGGGGTQWSRDARMWAWPIPAEGDLDLIFAWPVCGFEEARFTISGDQLREAAAACEAIWPDLPDGVQTAPDGPAPSDAPGTW